MKNSWWLDKAAELQGYADAENSKASFDGLWPEAVVPTWFLLLMDHNSTTPKREHFHRLLNWPPTVDNSAINRLNQCSTHSNLDAPPGSDGIPAEVFKKGGQVLHHKLLFSQTCCEAGKLPQNFRDATNITIFKCKLSNNFQ